MDKTVLLFSRDPGGANTIIPLYQPLIDKGYNVKLFGKDSALKKYADFKLPAINIEDSVSGTDIRAIETFIKAEKPDFIITGTSGDDFTERYIWKSADSSGIPSFAILDQWLNYGVRFSRYSVAHLAKYEEDKNHPFLPTKILVMDDYAKKEIVADGIDESRVLVTGHPYFEMLLKYRDSKTQNNGLEFKKQTGIVSTDFVITFASEPISEVYKEPDDAPHYWGYTERTILRSILSALQKITDTYSRNVTFIVRPHPKEKEDGCSDIFEMYRSSRLNIQIDKKANAWDLMVNADLVCGLSSMFLIEAAILGRPVMSVQIGLKRDDPFIFAKRELLETVLDEMTLFNKLKRVIINGDKIECDFKFIKNPVINVIKRMEEYI